MLEHKRITLLAGHYGSGKTNIAVNLAMKLRETCDNVVIADLDIVNPYFRTKDSEKELEKAGIRLICSKYANTNLDVPALPKEIYDVTDDRSITAVLDVGGDDRGALALGRYSPAIYEEGNYEMLLVVNKSRPLTMDAVSTIEVMREIESVSKLPFTAIVNNSNLGTETTAEYVLDSQKYADEISKLTGLPIKMTTVSDDIFPKLDGRIPNLFSMTLQSKII